MEVAPLPQRLRGGVPRMAEPWRGSGAVPGQLLRDVDRVEHTEPGVVRLAGVAFPREQVIAVADGTPLHPVNPRTARSRR